MTLFFFFLTKDIRHISAPGNILLISQSQDLHGSPSSSFFALTKRETSSFSSAPMKLPPSLGTSRHLWCPSLPCVFNLFNHFFPQAFKHVQVSAVFQSSSGLGLPLHFPVLKVQTLLIFSLSRAAIHNFNTLPYKHPSPITPLVWLSPRSPKSSCCPSQPQLPNLCHLVQL